MKDRLRKRIRAQFKKRSIKKETTTAILIGCSMAEYISYIESLWTDGMNWENYGIFGWHIDHIRPLSSFDLTDIEQQKAAFNFKNTQPLWAIDNIKKSAKWENINVRQ